MKDYRVSWKFFLLALWIFTCTAYAQNASNDLRSSNRPLVIAHRGDSAHNPENTLPAILRAFELGADIVEVDVRATRDNVLVLLHDDTVDRTTNGSGNIDSLTLAEVKLLDAGSWKSSKFKDVRIPTLAEALLATQNLGKLYLDVKTPHAGHLIAETLEHADIPVDRIVLSTPRLDDISDYQRYLPDASIMFWWDPWTHGSRFPVENPNIFIERLLSSGLTIDGIELRWEQFPMEWVDMCHRQGVAFWTFTLNSPKAIRAAQDATIDGVETDHPELVNRLHE